MSRNPGPSRGKAVASIDREAVGSIDREAVGSIDREAVGSTDAERAAQAVVPLDDPTVVSPAADTAPRTLPAPEARLPPAGPLNTDMSTTAYDVERPPVAHDP